MGQTSRALFTCGGGQKSVVATRVWMEEVGPHKCMRKQGAWRGGGTRNSDTADLCRDGGRWEFTWAQAALLVQEGRVRIVTVL